MDNEVDDLWRHNTGSVSQRFAPKFLSINCQTAGIIPTTNSKAKQTSDLSNQLCLIFTVSESTPCPQFFFHSFYSPAQKHKSKCSTPMSVRQRWKWSCKFNKKNKHSTCCDHVQEHKRRAKHHGLSPWRSSNRFATQRAIARRGSISRINSSFMEITRFSNLRTCNAEWRKQINRQRQRRQTYLQYKSLGFINRYQCSHTVHRLGTSWTVAVTYQ